MAQQQALPDGLALSKRFSAGVLEHDVWAFDLQAGRAVRLAVLPLKAKQRQLMKAIICGGVLFVSPRSGGKQQVRAWNLSLAFGVERSPAEMSMVPESRHSSKFKRLGAVAAVEGGSFRLAGGLGIGVAHVWLVSEGTARYEGSVKTRSSTIVALAFSEDGSKLATATFSDPKALVWDLSRLASRGDGSFDGKAGADAVEVALGAEALGVHVGADAAARFLAERQLAKAGSGRLGVREFVAAAIEDGSAAAAAWAGLFPPRLLDEYAYDGETNARGVPHGQGEQLLEDAEEGRLYKGAWVEGEPHGWGHVVDPATGITVYVGEFSHGLRHGFGWELSGSLRSKAALEVFVGYWHEGRRCGLGRSRYIRGDHEGCERVGVFGEHGMQWHTWPAATLLFGGESVPRGRMTLPCAAGLAAMQHLGAVRCVMAYDDAGRVLKRKYAEFGYHRAQGEVVPPADRHLFNFRPGDAAGQFADSPRYELPECWHCFQPVADDDAWVCNNRAGCAMRLCRDKCFAEVTMSGAHAVCWELPDAGGPDPLAGAEFDALVSRRRPSKGDPAAWRCPDPACQRLEMPQLAQLGAEQRSALPIGVSRKRPREDVARDAWPPSLAQVLESRNEAPSAARTPVEEPPAPPPCRITPSLSLDEVAAAAAAADTTAASRLATLYCKRGKEDFVLHTQADLMVAVGFARRGKKDAKATLRVFARRR